MSEVRPGYKQTDVGILPEEWGVAAFGNLFVRINGKKFQIQAAEYSSTGTYPVVDQGKFLIAGYSDRHDRIFRVPVDGVVVFGDHTRTFKFIDFDFVVGADGTQILMGTPRHQTRFLFGQLSRCEVPTTGYSRHFSVLKQMSFAYAPLPEQRAIAEMLEDADALIKAMDGLIAKKHAIKQGAMHELLIGNRRLPGFREEWTTAALGDIFDFGRTVPLSRAQLSQEGEVKYVHYGDIHTRLHNHLDFQRTPTPGADRLLCSSATNLEVGDWIVADASEDYEGVAKAIEITRLPVDKRAVAGLHTFVLRERGQTFAPGFKGYLANSSTFRAQVMRAATGMKVFGISKTQLKNVELNFPPTLDEQHAIAAVLSDMDAEVAALEAKLAKARAVKQAMMQVLLTGEIRLV